MTFKTMRRASLAVAALAVVAGAQAGTVTVRPDKASYTVGETAVFTVTDSRPRDMWVVVDPSDPTFDYAAGDFSLVYDPSVFSFLSLTYAPWLDAAVDTFPSDNSLVPPTNSVNVGIIGLNELELPETLSDIFSVSFAVRAAAPSTAVTITPGAGAYSFTESAVSVEAVAAIPEPSTYALMAAGLAAVGFAAWRRQRQDR